MKFFFLKLLYLIPVPLLIMGINLKVDPANILRSGQYESGVVDYLIIGKNVTNITNYDERLLQKDFIEKMRNCPLSIILGSSRVMQIGNGYFPDEKLINNGVSGASIEDLMAIYYLYEQKGCSLKKVTIGLEPYYLNDNNDQSRWRVLLSEYNSFLDKLKLPSYKDNQKILDTKYSRYKELWSLSYFKSSLSYLIKGVDVNYHPTLSIANKGITKLVDGSIYYGEESRNSSQEIVNGYAIRSINESPMYSMRNFTRFSVKYQVLFSAFITYLKEQDIEVEFFISPYHPIVYDFCVKHANYKIIFDSEKYYRELANKFNIRIIGSYNPRDYNFSDSSFYDGFHCREKALSIVIKSSSSL